MSVVRKEPRATTKMTADGDSLADLLVPAIPAMISSLLLEGLADLRGIQKIGAGAILGVILWGILRYRRAGPVRVRTLYRRGWAVSLLAVAAVAVGALVVTVAAFDRPTTTTTTAVATMVVLVALEAVALTGRRMPGAAAAAVTGGLVGLCLGIAVL